MTKEKKNFMRRPGKWTLDVLLSTRPAGYALSLRRRVDRVAAVRPLKKWEEVVRDLIPDKPRRRVAASKGDGFCPVGC